MIAARLHDESGKIVIMLVLEPGNIEKLQKGDPIHKFLSEFVPELPANIELLLSYTPDAVWVSQQINKETDALSLGEAIDQSLSRRPVFIRDRTAEEMKRVF